MTTYLVEVIEVMLQGENLGPIENLRRDVVTVAVEHDVLVDFTFLAGAFREDGAKLLELLLRHRLHGLLDDTGAELLLAELAEVAPDELVEAAHPHVRHLTLALRQRDEVLQDLLDHEVAELVVDQRLNTLEGHTDQILLPGTLRSRDALLYDLAAVLVLRHLREVLHDGLVDDRATFVRLQEHQALAEDVVAAHVAAQVEDAAALEGLVDQRRGALGPLMALDEFVLEEHLQGPRAVDVRPDLAKVVPNGLEDPLELLLRSLPEELLAEEVGDLVHH